MSEFLSQNKNEIIYRIRQYYSSIKDILIDCCNIQREIDRAQKKYIEIVIEEFGLPKKSRTIYSF